MEGHAPERSVADASTAPPGAADGLPARGRRLAVPVALAAVALAAYGNTLGNGFVWDDGYIIVENPATRDLGSAGDLLLAPDVVKPYYRPVTRTSYLLDYSVFGMNPWGFHAVNVAAHLANVLLLYWLGLRLFRRRAPAVVAALLLAVHPVNAESVNFVSARNNLLALLFVLVALHLLARAWESGRPWVWSLLSAASWFLALLSKESAAAAVLFFGGWALSPLVPAHVPRRARLLSLLPHLVVAGAYLVLRRLALGDVVGEGLGFGGLLRALRLNYHVVPRYLELLVFPSRLNLFHRTPETGPASEPWLLLVWAALLLVVGLLLRRRSVPTLLGLLWVLVNFAPISNLVPIPSAAMAERYLYLPAVGIWIVLGDQLGRLWEHTERRRLLAGAFAVWIAALSARTVLRNTEWKDEVSLFGSIVRVDPGSAVGHYNLGCALQERGNMEGARRAWERTVELDARHAEALAQLGTVAAYGGDLARAEQLYLAALAANAVDPMVHFNLARVYERLGRPAEALARYDQFLRGAGPDQGDFVARAIEGRARLAGAGPPAAPAAPSPR